MKRLIVAAAFLAVASCCKGFLEDHEFNTWKHRHGRSYSSPSEEAHRRQTWLVNRKTVLMHNILADQGMKSYRLDVNHFADMTQKEYKEKFCSSYNLKSALSARSGSTSVGVSDVNNMPATVDWRNMGYVTEVKDQKLCGACWAFSATGSLEGQHFKKTGNLVSLSEQQLVDCSDKNGNKGCMGGLMVNAFKYIQANGGINAGASYPYEANNKTCRYNSNTIAASCKGFVGIHSGDEGALTKAVATIGPISVAIDASLHSFQLYGSGVFDEPACSSQTNHGVLVVGYGTQNENDYWLVKNSWGPSWGDKGYIKMTRNKSNQCGIANLCSFPLV